MKKSLLATVAAAALIAGPAFAQKQEAPAGDVKGATPPPAAIQNAPAEKVAPAGKAAPDRAAQDRAMDRKAPASTTGQATPSPKADQSKPDMKASDTKPGSKASGTKATDKPNAQSGTTAQGGAAARPSGAAVNLTTEQKDKVRTTVLRGNNAPRVTNINFSLSVGTVVPRTVRVVAVPPTLIEIHPAWRGYRYFVYNDQIVIVEPDTLRIVTIISV